MNNSNLVNWTLASFWLYIQNQLKPVVARRCLSVSVFLLPSHSLYLQFKSLDHHAFFSNGSRSGVGHAIPSPPPFLFPFIWRLTVAVPAYLCLSTTFPLRCYSDLYQTEPVNMRGAKKKKNCQGSKGRILKCFNPPSVCWCLFCCTLTLPLLFPPVDLVAFGGLEK